MRGPVHGSDASVFGPAIAVEAAVERESGARAFVANITINDYIIHNLE